MGGGALMFFVVIRQISRSQGTENHRVGRFWTVRPMWIHWWLWNDAQNMKHHRRGAVLFFKVIRQFPFEFSDGYEIMHMAWNSLVMMHKAWHGVKQVPYCFKMSSAKLQGHTGQKYRFWPEFCASGLPLQFLLTNGFEMMHKAYRNIGDVPYCFSRLSIKCQCQTGQNIWWCESILSKIIGPAEAIKSQNCLVSNILNMGWIRFRISVVHLITLVLVPFCYTQAIVMGMWYPTTTLLAFGQSSVFHVANHIINVQIIWCMLYCPILLFYQSIANHHGRSNNKH